MMLVRVDNPERTLHLPNLLIQKVARMVRLAEVELCGFLLGPRWRMRQVENVSSHPDRFYEMHAGQMTAALGEMDDVPPSNLEPNVVVWHSHPASRAIPSQTDIEYAVFPQHLLFGWIGSSPRLEVAAYYIKDGRSIPINICPHG